MTNRHLFLDLEDTVIEPVPFGWGNTALINVAKVQEFIKSFKPTKLHLFSFAIYDENDLKLFNYHIRNRLENALGLQIDLCPSVYADIIPACCRIKNLAPTHVSFSDVIEFWGKQDSFKLYIQDTLKNTNTPVSVAFLDDAVTDEYFQWPHLQITGVIRNINQL